MYFARTACLRKLYGMQSQTHAIAYVYLAIMFRKNTWSPTFLARLGVGEPARPQEQEARSMPYRSPSRLFSYQVVSFSGVCSSSSIDASRLDNVPGVGLGSVQRRSVCEIRLSVLWLLG